MSYYVGLRTQLFRSSSLPSRAALTEDGDQNAAPCAWLGACSWPPSSAEVFNFFCTYSITCNALTDCSATADCEPNKAYDDEKKMLAHAL